MYSSAEMRWFFEGDVPETVRAWFGTEGRGGDEAERIDEYLTLPGCESTGVKLREGRLEIKARTSAPVTVALPGDGLGRREGWVKWSLSLSELESLRESLAAADEDWVFVRKRRRLRKLAIDGGRVTEVDAKTTGLGDGCQIEIASLMALRGTQGVPAVERDWSRSVPWWSLCFEAFGGPDSLSDCLLRCAGEFLQRPAPLTLRESDSLSYPGWLARRRPG
jgi:hypothetical protein